MPLISNHVSHKIGPWKIAINEKIYRFLLLISDEKNSRDFLFSLASWSFTNTKKDDCGLFPLVKTPLIKTRRDISGFVELYLKHSCNDL